MSRTGSAIGSGVFGALVLFLLSGLSSQGLAACDSHKEPPACKDLLNCCSELGNGGTSSCSATAMSGELDDAGCGQELAMYVSSGQCTGSGGSSPPVADAAAAD